MKAAIRHVLPSAARRVRRMLTAMRMLAAAFVLVSSAARADVTAEVSAGAGSQGSASVYGTGNAAVTAEASDDDERDFARAEASATWLGTDLIGDVRATAAARGAELDVGVTAQPVGDLRDIFWRSGRGALAATYGIQVPGRVVWSIPWTRIWFGGFELTGEQRTAGAGRSALTASGRLLRVREPHWTLDLAAVHAVGYSSPGPDTDTTTSSLVANDFGGDVAALRWAVSPALELRASGGVDVIEPMFEQVDTVVGDGGPTQSALVATVTPRYWLELDQHTDDSAVTVGAGSWARLDPTGNAADAGQLASTSYDSRIGPLHVHASAEAGRLVRRLVGSLAPPDLAPPGTRMWMGRGELAASLRVARHIELVGNAWLERSDRDDPRWLAPATGALATHAGADLAARWHSRST